MQYPRHHDPIAFVFILLLVLLGPWTMLRLAGYAAVAVIVLGGLIGLHTLTAAPQPPAEAIAIKRCGYDFATRVDESVSPSLPQRRQRAPCD
jgi:hypothetical protein